MRKSKWSNNEIKHLIDNYPTKGLKFCVETLKFSEKTIKNKIRLLRLKMDPEVKKLNQYYKPNNECNINPELFYKLESKEVIYLLGLIWADGFIYSSKNKKNFHLGFTMVKNDLFEIKKVLDDIGKWGYYERNNENNNTWKTTINVLTNNKRIFDFLIDHDYHKKSKLSANKILSKIPENLKHYFFRGLIDGDGCFYYYKPKNGSILRQFILTSTYEQDWYYFEKLCEELSIKYSIKRKINKKSSSSVIRITNKDGIKKLGDYIYQNFNIDNIGLKRKFKKYELIVSEKHI